MNILSKIQKNVFFKILKFLFLLTLSEIEETAYERQFTLRREKELKENLMYKSIISLLVFFLHL